MFRICVLGDSNAFGWWVLEEETYAKQLERMLNASDAFPDTRFEVYNMGVPGYNALQYLALFREETLAYDPDLVLIGYTFNDEFIGADGGLWRKHRDTGWAGLDYLRLQWTLYWHSRGGESLLHASFKKIAGLADAHGVPVVAVFVPPAPDHAWAIGQYQRDKQYALDAGIGAIDLIPRFEEIGWARLISDGVHPTERGHEAIAEAIRDWIVDRFANSEGA